jgi:hypothetical protein
MLLRFNLITNVLVYQLRVGSSKVAIEIQDHFWTEKWRIAVACGTIGLEFIFLVVKIFLEFLLKSTLRRIWTMARMVIEILVILALIYSIF